MNEKFPLPDPELRCSKTCPGWLIGKAGRGPEIQRCDECWHLDPRGIEDSDFEKQPVCQAVLTLYCSGEPPAGAGEDPVWQEALELFLSGTVCSI